MTTKNRQITPAARPVGFPRETDFRLVESPLPVPGSGQFLVRTVYLSVDPYMRGRMNDRASYAAPVSLGEVMVGGAVGKVIESHNDRFPPGSVVDGFFGWQDYALSDGTNVRQVDPAVAPISTALGVLGMPGLTAYFGLLDIGKPQAGETVLVSGAAGAVGSLVGQIAKLKGCYVVGVAGSEDKVRHILHDLHFDTAFNYKTDTNYIAKLKEVCPKGIDVYFDNVGGAITDAVFQVMNIHARISVCGQMSQYNLEKPEMGPRLLFKLIEKRARVEGFLVFDYADRYKEGLTQLAQWLRSGQIVYRESIVEGLENAPRAFLGMLQGENVGKQLVQVVDA
jgi:NADPH-dependent curcumin reductase CurA